MDFRLTEEQRAVQDLAARILADADATAAEDGMDRTAWRNLADAGLLGIALPEADGGGGLGFLEVHVLLEEAGAVAAAVPVWETVVLGALPVARFGSSELRRRVLPPIVAGETLATAALEDADGAPVVEPTTRATREGDGWRLHGEKTAVPLARQADHVLVSARTDEGDVGVFVVGTDADGVETRPQKLVGDTPAALLLLDGVPVADADVLGAPDRGGSVLRWLLQRARAGIASLQAGICRGALKLAAGYTSEREQFGRPVASFQAVGQRLGDAYIDVEALRLTALQAAWRLSTDAAGDGSPDDEVSIAAWWAAEAGHRVLHACQHVHGGVGVDRDYPLHRYFLLTKRLEYTLGTAPEHLDALGESLARSPA